MQYALLFYQSPEDFAARTDPAKSKQFWGSFLPYMDALNAAGIVVAGAGLEPPATGVTLLRNGHTQDGPFAETKEQLGGFFIIDVPTAEVALEWAARFPLDVGGGVEVRPGLPPMPRG